jgi:small basic protein
MAAIVYWSSTLVAAGLVTLIVLVALGIATYGAIVYALNMRTFRNEARSLIRLFLGR